MRNDHQCENTCEANSLCVLRIFSVKLYAVEIITYKVTLVPLSALAVKVNVFHIASDQKGCRMGTFF